MGAQVGDSHRFSRYWRDVAWQSSGTSLAQLVGVAGIPVLTRLYSPGDFAVQSLFLQVVTYATALVSWRYEYFIQLPKSDADAKGLNRLVLGFGIIAVIALTPLIWIVRDGVARHLGNQDVAPWLVLAPATAVLVSWAVMAQNNAQRSGDFRTSGLSELAGKLSYVASGVAGALLSLGALGLVVATAMSAVGKSAYVFVMREGRQKEAPGSGADAMKRVRLRYARLATLTVVAHVLTTSAIAMPQVAMSHLYGAEVLGQFALVLATIYLPTGLLGAAIGSVYYQRAARQWAEGRPFVALWRGTAARLALIGVPVYAAVALVSGIAYPYVFGDQWRLAGELAVPMALAACGSFVTSPLDRTCLVVGAGSYLLLWSLFRTFTAALVIWLAWARGFTPMGFVMALAIQASLAYGIDFWMGHRFSQGRLGYFAGR